VCYGIDFWFFLFLDLFLCYIVLTVAFVCVCYVVLMLASVFWLLFFPDLCSHKGLVLLSAFD
jgi:hypothetical protein